MSTAVVLSCTVGGAVAGGLLDVVAARIPPAPPRSPPPADQAGGADPAPVAAVPVALPVAPPAPAFERPLAGLVAGVLCGLAAFRLGPVPELAAYCVLFVGLVAVSTVDIRVGLVPRVILYPTLGLMVVALVAASAVDGTWRSLGDAAIAGAVALALFFAIWWFAPRGLGFGDVRLAGVIGVGLGWLGFAQAYLGFLVAFLVGAVWGLVVMGIRGTGRKTRIAFAPALAAGAVVGVLWGGWLAHLWLHRGS